MKIIKLALLSSALLAGAASAAPSCNGFQIRLKNDLDFDLLVTTIKLHGAEIQPGTFEKLNSKGEQVFVVNKSVDNVPMDGEFTLRTVTLPSKTVTIRYSLENKLGVCEHSDFAQNNDYSVDKTRRIGEVQYTIANH